MSRNTRSQSCQTEQQEFSVGQVDPLSIASVDEKLDRILDVPMTKSAIWKH